MPLAAAATGALAYVLGIPTLRLKSYYLAMATLGIGVVLHLAFVQLYSVTGGSSGLAGILPWDVGPLRFVTATHHYFLVWAFAAAALWIARNLVNSRVGRVLRALSESEVAAGDGRGHCGGEAARVRPLRGLRLRGGSLHAHYITVPAESSPSSSQWSSFSWWRRRGRPVLGRGGGGAPPHHSPGPRLR